MTKPIVPARIGNDVYIRDCEDRTVQLKAKVYDVDFAKQEAAVGFYPERSGPPFSEIHLPDIYRASVPLAELSLEPHSGAAQKGYAELLLASGEPAASIAWMDNVGVQHVPGDPVPARVLDKTVPVPQVTEAVPEFDDEDPRGLSVAQLVQQTAVAQSVLKPTPKTQPPFSKVEIERKYAECVVTLAQLRRMIDTVA